VAAIGEIYTECIAEFEAITLHTALERLRKLGNDMAKLVISPFYNGQPQTTLVAEVDGKVCGYISYYIENNICRISDLFVFKQFRRQGIGRVLMQACAQRIMEFGCRQIKLWPLKSSGTLSFYEVLGGKGDGQGRKPIPSVKGEVEYIYWPDASVILKGLDL
jgi:GNAT superfamily N-acetyltransferase